MECGQLHLESGVPAGVCLLQWRQRELRLRAQWAPGQQPHQDSERRGNYRTFFPHDEEENGVAIKYYVFNGMRIAVQKGSTLHYIHGDHLGSMSVATDSSGNGISGSWLKYYAYGAVRKGNPALVPTDRTFTGQKSDGTGLLYYNARYYDPALGTFLSPDTIVPDAGAVIDYNRFLYARGNPVKYTDPSGHCADGITTILCAAAAGFAIGFAVDVTRQIASQAIEQVQSGGDVNITVDWGQAIGSGASGAVTGMFLTGGGAAAGLIATAGKGAIGGLLGGQAETLVTATIHEGQVQGVSHLDATRIVQDAKQDGFLSAKRMAVDAGVGALSGATAAVLGPKLDKHLVDRGFASGRRLNSRFIPVIGHPNPHQYYEYTAPMSRAVVGSGVKSGFDAAIEMSSQVTSDEMCEAVGCP